MQSQVMRVDTVWTDVLFSHFILLAVMIGSKYVRAVSTKYKWFAAWKKNYTSASTPELQSQLFGFPKPNSAGSPR